MIKQRHNYFLKHRFANTSDFERDLGLSFRPHEVRVKSVSFAVLPGVGVISGTYVEDEAPITIHAVSMSTIPNVYTLHWEGLGDICALKPESDRAADYTFILKTPIDGLQRFQIRRTTGKAVAPSDINQSELIIHLEFVEFLEKSA